MSSLWLIPMSGPTIESIEIRPSTSGLTLGRHEKCELRVSGEAEQVSRQHAKFSFDQIDGWRLQDLGSRWGTFINGVKLNPRQPIPIREGDLVGILPWSFKLATTPHVRGLHLSDDIGKTVVRALNDQNTPPLADNLLQILLESAGQIHASTSEEQLAENVISAALRGTGLTNAVMLKPLDGLRSFQFVGSHISAEAQNSPAQFSRSLINAAAGGNVAEIGAGSGVVFSESLMQMSVSAAICAPLVLGGSAAAFLYLDSRGSVLQSVRPNGSAFCLALSKMASLALANLKRVEIEKRQFHMDAELLAAATAQKWIMPRRETCFGPLKIIGESRSGQSVGGDFFDIIPLDAARVAVALGDVSGKGVSASVLMTATQGFLHAALQQFGDPGRAVTALNNFIYPRRPSSRFVTMWVGVIDCSRQTLQYVDAAHGYALLRRADGTMVELNAEGGLPIGVAEDGQYAACDGIFGPGDQIVLASDGIVEQPSLGSSDAVRVEFEIAGIRDAMKKSLSDPVKYIFERVIAHAGTDQLADDATAVSVSW